MNNSYISYKFYVESTDYYKGLGDATRKIRNIKNNIDTLIKALGEVNGPNIFIANNDLKRFKDKLNKIMNYYNSLKNSLGTNAYLYDVAFKSLKNEYAFKATTVYTFSGLGTLESSIVDFSSLTEGVNYNANKSTHSNRIEIDDNTGYIKHVSILKSSGYCVTSVDGTNYFDIFSGTPTNVIVKEYPTSIQEWIGGIYNKEKQKINVSNM